MIEVLAYIAAGIFAIFILWLLGMIFLTGLAIIGKWILKLKAAIDRTHSKVEKMGSK
jgi:hypothetical protein